MIFAPGGIHLIALLSILSRPKKEHLCMLQALFHNIRNHPSDQPLFGPAFDATCNEIEVPRTIDGWNRMIGCHIVCDCVLFAIKLLSTAATFNAHVRSQRVLVN